MSAKQKALAKKGALEEERAAAAAKQAEAAEEADWAVGAKNNKKEAAKAEAEAEKLRKAKEKKELEDADNAALSGVVVKKTATKKKGPDSLDILNSALASAPKSKAQKEAEAKKKAEEDAKQARIAAEEERRLAKEAAAEKDAAEIRRLASKGMVMNHTDDLLMHSKSHNKLDDEDEIDVTGLEEALSGLAAATGSGKGEDMHPEKRMKALYNAYYERELVQMKEDHPGLKLSQYKERIFENWKKSAENPSNQPKDTVFKNINSVEM
jgi:hypothetical protein